MGHRRGHHAARANQAATQARDDPATALGEATVARIRNRYHGALARGDTDNHGEHSVLAAKARTLINRFRRTRT